MGGERRVCVEFLPPDELGHTDVRSLLVAAGVAPMLAAPTVDRHPAIQAQADALVAQVLAGYRKAGLSPCVWPLLADEDGYWPSANNAERFCARVAALRAAAASAGVPFAAGDTVAIDLEPPVTALGDPGARRLPFFSPCPAGRFAAAGATLARLSDLLRRDGLRTLAIAYPMVSAERAGSDPWQRRYLAPLDCGWDRVGIMTYSSMIAGYSQGLLSVAAARRYGYRALRSLSARYPGRAAAFVGICGHGKLGDEPAHSDPAALALDAAAAWAAGVTEVTAFCLEGILRQPDPLAWLSALSAPPQAPPLSLRGEAAHLALVALGRVLPLWDAARPGR